MSNPDRRGFLLALRHPNITSALQWTVSRVCVRRFGLQQDNLMARCSPQRFICPSPASPVPEAGLLLCPCARIAKAPEECFLAMSGPYPILCVGSKMVTLILLKRTNELLDPLQNKSDRVLLSKCLRDRRALPPILRLSICWWRRRAALIFRMVRFAIATVEVTAPDGTKTLWVAGLPHSEAVAAVKQVIPASHRAQLSFISLSRSPMATDLCRGEIRYVDGPWRP
jgi:hypothetical protein